MGECERKGGTKMWKKWKEEHKRVIYFARGAILIKRLNLEIIALDLPPVVDPWLTDA